ncbi:MAG: class I SAM-dependent methyltransferase [Armatimonadota bacterium]|nr:class I SAM-dependent methyltransferase [Armatimonadota bacterium]MDR7427815.1 class I SAM-dependent methyltransferase [Armatimonadota bacterium]MDR7463132.1 class I SAM-dependent methyltransferase [Armatimonadota bacterium]MDR7468881.1 class I SAM-dependent methyltransferase [Armatimonadota bacterium]MDR7474878.1 class I SAM-dependent methyltransferase [Armatimonadota bacterium]
MGARLGPLFRWRYRRAAPRYEADVIARTPGYDAALRAALEATGGDPRWCGDIAAGTGSATRLLRTRFPRARIVAVDLSPAMLARLRPAPALYRVVGNGWALPLATGALEVVVLQNAPPPFGELARVLLPGGTLLVALSSAGALPPALRRWLLWRAVPPALGTPRETVAGPGVTWTLRRVD